MMARLRRFGPLAWLFIAAPMWADSTSDIITKTACSANPSALGCATNTDPLAKGGIFYNGILVFISVIAAISVIMVVIGGLRYVLSGGDSSGIKGAKDTILYALIGLGVSLVAYTIVGFVIGRLG